MGPLQRRSLAVLSLAAALGCVSASHHFQRMDSRSSPREGTCSSLPLYTDRGPTEQRRRPLAIVTAECGRNSEAECRDHLMLGGCEAGGDAVVEITNQIAFGKRRMVGTVIEWVNEP